MPLRCWLAGLVLVSAAPVRAHDAAVEPPKIGQPADFSQVVGAFRMAVRAEPTAVAVEQPILLTVTIAGQSVSPYVPKREHLRLFPDEFHRDFFIEPAGETMKDGEWEFVYRLRPKHEQVRFVPGLKLVYYAPRQRRFQTAYAEALALTVLPRKAAEIPPSLQVVRAPPFFFETAAEGVVRFWRLPRWATGVILVGAPLLCACGAWQWRSRQLRGERGRRQQRQATRRATAALATAADPETASAALIDFLRERFGYPSAEPTARELERWLKRRGVGAVLRQQGRRLLADCAALCYGPGENAMPDELVREIVEFIDALENEPCLAAR